VEILLTAASLPEAPAEAAVTSPGLDAPPIPPIPTDPTPPASVPEPALEPAPEPSPEPTSLRDFDWHDLVEPDLWSEVPADVDELLRMLPSSDLYVQDEVDVRLHPTLHQIWSRKGSRGQRLVRAPGTSRRFVGFGAFDWRDGFLSVGYGLSRNAEVFCLQLDHLVERSTARGRKAIVLLDNLGIHTTEGSKRLRETVKRHEGKLRLVYTPPYDPEANPSERLWPRFRLAVTHNHHRDDLPSLYQDTLDYFDRLDVEPNRVLRHLGSPHALLDDRQDDSKLSPDKALTREEATAA
jgi:transposase